MRLSLRAVTIVKKRGDVKQTGWLLTTILLLSIVAVGISVMIYRRALSQRNTKPYPESATIFAITPQPTSSPSEIPLPNQKSPVPSSPEVTPLY